MGHNPATLAFVVAIVIMLLVGAHALTTLRDLIRSNRQFSQTLVLMRGVGETLALLIDAETSQRGYVITGDHLYLEPYFAALDPGRGITAQLRDLHGLAIEGPGYHERLTRLDSLVALKLAGFRETIDRRGDRDFTNATAIDLTVRGKETMDAIREVIGGLEAEGRDLLRRRSDDASVSLRNMLLAMVIGALTSLALLTWSFRIARREVRERRQAEASVQHLNSELESRVLARTSELMEAYRSLHASEQRLRATLDSMLEGGQVVGFDWTYVYVNDAAERHNRRPRSELLGRSLHDVWPGIEQTDVHAAMHRAMTERVPVHMECEFVFPDGTRGWFELRIQPIPEGIFILSADITERIRAEREAQERAQRFKYLLSLMKDVAWLGDAKTGRMLDVNDAFESLYGLSGEEFAANPELWIDLVHPEDRAIAASSARDLASTGKASVEYRVTRRDGSVRWVLDRKALTYDADGRPDLMWGIAQDITARKLADAEIKRQLQHLRSLRNIDLTILGVTDLRLALELVSREVCSSLEVDMAAVVLCDAVSLTLEGFAAWGNRTPVLERIRGRLGEGFLGRGIMARQTLGFGDLAREAPPDLPEEVLEEGIRAFFLVPLAAKGRQLGALCVAHRRPLAPAPEWIERLETLAGQTSIAIDNAQLFDGLQRSNTELVLAYDATIEGWSRAMDLRDHETEGHTQRVTDLTLRLARAAGMSDAELVHIKRGALLHDMGKLGVPDAILLKPGKLTDEEWEVMKQHPVFAYEMLSPIAHLRPALDIPYCHHEKWDGTGYPRGLAGEQIPLSARLFAVVDVWDALRSDRPYRPAWTEERTRAYLREQAGTHFDPRAVDLFLRTFAAPSVLEPLRLTPAGNRPVPASRDR